MTPRMRRRYDPHGHLVHYGVYHDRYGRVRHFAATKLNDDGEYQMRLRDEHFDLISTHTLRGYESVAQFLSRRAMIV